MFRDRIFEWGRLLDNLFNAWIEVKVITKAKSGSVVSGLKRRTGPNIDPRRAELNRTMGIAYIQPNQFNR